MLSIHSLTLHLSMDHETLFSMAELNCMHWRRGTHNGEIIVEIDMVESIELAASEGTLSGDLRIPAVHMSTVGMYAEGELWLPVNVPTGSISLAQSTRL